MPKTKCKTTSQPIDTDILTHTDKNGVQATRMVDESGNEDVAKN